MTLALLAIPEQQLASVPSNDCVRAVMINNLLVQIAGLSETTVLVEHLYRLLVTN